jgi:IS4 transposase
LKDYIKSNAVYKVIKRVSRAERVKYVSMVTREQWIEVSYKTDKEEKILVLRKVCYQDQWNRKYVFISNNLDITAEEIALIYRKRWGI